MSHAPRGMRGAPPVNFTHHARAAGLAMRTCDWATATARSSKEVLAQESFSSTPTQGISSHGVLSMSEDATEL